MDEEFDDIWRLVEGSSQGVAPPWEALRKFYCDKHPLPLLVIDSLLTAEELGFIKRVDDLKWRLTVKGYKVAEKLWGPKEVACKDKKKQSVWDLLR